MPDLGSLKQKFSKISDFDDRIIQPQPEFQIKKGGLQYTHKKTAATTQTVDGMEFKIDVSNYRTFVDRDIKINGSIDVEFTVTRPRVSLTSTVNNDVFILNGKANVPAAYASILGAAGEKSIAVVRFGKDACIAPYPIHQMFSSLTQRTNGTETTIKLDKLLQELLLLMDSDPNKNEFNHTCPQKLPKLANNRNIKSCYNHILGTDGIYSSTPGNGCSYKIEFLNPVDGTVLTGTNYVTFANGLGPANGAAYGGGYVNDAENGTRIMWVDGIPRLTPVANGNNIGDTLVENYKIAVRITSTESLMIPPFIFNKNFKGVDTGLFAVNNIEISTRHKANANDLIRFVYDTDGPFDSVNATVPIIREDLAGVLQNAATVSEGVAKDFASGDNERRVTTNISFRGVDPLKNFRIESLHITPALEMPLPSYSIVPYYDFKTHTYNNSVNLVRGSKANLSVGGINLTNIPDSFIMYVIPTNYDNTFKGVTNRWYIPITNVSILFDNTDNLGNTYPKEDLYRMTYESIKVGEDIYFGEGYKGDKYGNKEHLLGCPTVLKLNKHLPLITGQAPGLTGKFNFSADIQIQMPSSAQTGNGTPITNANPITSVTVVIATPSAGYFLTQNGESLVDINMLSAADVIQAKVSVVDQIKRSERAIGRGGGFFSNISNALGKISTKVAERIGNKLIDKGISKIEKRIGLGIDATTGSGKGGTKKNVKMSEQLKYLM